MRQPGRPRRMAGRTSSVSDMYFVDPGLQVAVMAEGIVCDGAELGRRLRGRGARDVS